MLSLTRAAIGLWCIAVACTVSCGASNPYGFGRTYSPLDAEEPYFERAIDVSYEEVRRDPQAFSGRVVGWFGVVTGAKRLPSGEVQLALELRFHQPRHLCTDQFESSCRVTISDRAGGPFSTTLRLRPEDDNGAERVNTGSLVRVYGSPNGDFDDRGGPVIKAEYYRQWPHGAYIPASSNNAMRR